MSLSIQINRDDQRPVYLQIASQIKNQISTGRLPPGTRLPSVRQLADALNVNRLTVHNAYSELQADGWVESTVGRGTYVLQQAQPMTILSSATAHISPDSVLSDFHPIKQIPSLRSLASTEPDSCFAPIDELWGMLMGLRRDAANLLSYESPQGDAALRVALSTSVLPERGVEALPDEIIVTSGAMQGLSMVARILAKPGDNVLVEEPTYLGLIHILRTQGLNPIPVPLDENGPDLDMIERSIQRDKPRFMYTIPTFHNPTGYVMAHERRVKLLEIAARYGLTIVEDDINGSLAYDSPPPPALKSLDKDERVVYISSVSKMLAPGLRVGWVIAPCWLQRQLLSLRMATDLYGPAFIQRALANFLDQGRLKPHLRRVLPLYRARRDAFLRAMDRHMPEGVTWTRPTGGFSNWVTLPQENMIAIYRAALQQGVAFTPGQAFLSGSTANRHMRVCYSTQPAEDFDDILALLGSLIQQENERGTLLETEPVPIYTPVT